jgi:hypothetical protein
MAFSIHYRSSETMHPARAYEIKQHAERLVEGFVWFSCQPVLLQQTTDGYLGGHSKPNFFPAESDPGAPHADGLPDGTIVTLAELLCVLSREHGVNWDVGHDYEPEPIGRICDGIADPELIEQLETFGSMGDLLDDMMGEWDDDLAWDGVEDLLPEEPSGKKEANERRFDEEEPRVLKFPGTE